MPAVWMVLLGYDEYDVDEDGGEEVTHSMDGSK